MSTTTSFESEPFCAMTWGWVGERGSWTGPRAQESLNALADTGVNWIIPAFSALQESAQSETVDRDLQPTVTDDEIRAIVRASHDRGLKVCLKPTVNCADGTWRAYIGFLEPDVPGEPTWGRWFESYTDFVLDAAMLAHEEHAEMLCVGCEMVRSDHREADWRRLIARVREVYDGPIAYNCDKYQEDRLTWWDAVDIMSSSGYYPSGRWNENLDRIEAAVQRTGKPFVFMEAGCPSRAGSSQRPNDWAFGGDADEIEQAHYLDEMFTQMRSRPWVRGAGLWDWPAALYPVANARENRDYCMYAKPGEDVLRRHVAQWLRS